MNDHFSEQLKNLRLQFGNENHILARDLLEIWNKHTGSDNEWDSEPIMAYYCPECDTRVIKGACDTKTIQGVELLVCPTNGCEATCLSEDEKWDLSRKITKLLESYINPD